jgi:surface protein
MFTSCSSLEEIDLSTFYTDQFSTDTSNIPLYMTFDGCNSLTTVYVNADWSLSRIGTSGKTANAFGVSPSCALLIGGNGSTLTSINENKQSSEPDANRVYWARIDTPSQMGLFTLK